MSSACEGIYPYVDNALPTYEEAIDFVTNAVVELRSRPQEPDKKGPTHAVDEKTFIVGLIALYLNGTEPTITRAQAAASTTMTLSVMTQTILQRSYMLGAAEAATRLKQQAKDAKGRPPA